MNSTLFEGEQGCAKGNKSLIQDMIYPITTVRFAYHKVVREGRLELFCGGNWAGYRILVEIAHDQ